MECNKSLIAFPQPFTMMAFPLDVVRYTLALTGNVKAALVSKALGIGSWSPEMMGVWLNPHAPYTMDVEDGPSDQQLQQVVKLLGIATSVTVPWDAGKFAERVGAAAESCEWLRALLSSQKTKDRLLAQAAGTGNLRVCEALLQAPLEAWLMCALERASRAGHVDVCRMLLDHYRSTLLSWGDDPSELEVEDALNHAPTAEILRLFLEYGAVNECDDDHWCHIIQSAEDGRIDLLDVYGDLAMDQYCAEQLRGAILFRLLADEDERDEYFDATHLAASLEWVGRKFPDCGLVAEWQLHCFEGDDHHEGLLGLAAHPVIASHPTVVDFIHQVVAYGMP